MKKIPLTIVIEKNELNAAVNIVDSNGNKIRLSGQKKSQDMPYALPGCLKLHSSITMNKNKLEINKETILVKNTQMTEIQYVMPSLLFI